MAFRWRQICNSTVYSHKEIRPSTTFSQSLFSTEIRIQKMLAGIGTQIKAHSFHTLMLTLTMQT